MEKTKTFVFLGIIIVIGGLVPFGAQFLIPLFNENINIVGAEIWNQYVSIILGIVATILSVVSLKMCFASDEQARNTELRTQETLDKIDARIQLLSQKQDQLYKTISESKTNKALKNLESDTNWKSKGQYDEIRENATI